MTGADCARSDAACGAGAVGACPAEAGAAARIQALTRMVFADVFMPPFRLVPPRARRPEGRTTDVQLLHGPHPRMPPMGALSAAERALQTLRARLSRLT